MKVEKLATTRKGELMLNPHFTHCPPPQRGFECNRLWVLKNSLSGATFWVSVPLSRFLTPHSYAVAGRTGVVGWLRNRTRRLMF